MIATRPIHSPRSHLAPSLGKPRWAASAAILALLLHSSRGAAQAEAQKPAPNVLLLVDNSGSMEFKTDGTFPTCTPGNSALSQKSRWIDLVEVLTGTFDGYSCWKERRNTPEFKSEFSLSGVQPYDYGYVNPYHRPLSNMCVYGPGVLPPGASPYSWPSRYVNTFPVVAGGSDGFAASRPATASLPSYTGCADFHQNNDGLLDTYSKVIRFGLMTFDARTSAGTGLSSGNANYTTGMDGNWSYYVGAPVTGYPINCGASPEPPQEVGARNAAAPPWEGRMVAFGPPNEGDPSVRNGWIQDVLVSTRPYGATPIAGQLDDAKQFLYNDASTDPLNSSEGFGPRNDPNWKASDCRKTILILLTDGEPNLDLRPYCMPEPAGKCPYQKPADIVRALRDGTGAPQANMTVETYVIGFALSSVRPAGNTTDISCSQLTDAQCTANPNNVNIQACCTLNEIAANGGNDVDGTPRKAYFASNRTELKEMFADIFDDVVRVATRTMPVFSSPGGDTTSKGFKFFSAFKPQPDPSKSQLWKGVLTRTRFVCTDDLEVKTESDEKDGDDFAANLNSGTGNERRFYTVIADGNTSHNSVRPFIAADDDGLGTVGGDQDVATGPNAVTGMITPEAMAIDDDTCEGTQTNAACRDLIVKYLVGLENADLKSRCTSAGCELFGGIYHSVPTTVPGRPSDLLRDESYQQFAAEMAGLARPSVLYTSTVDGFLHAFNLAPFPNSADAAKNAITEKKNNELWSFIPPAVLPFLDREYPTTPVVLLDGVPIIKDVVATKTSDDPPVVKSYERIRDDAQVGGGAWRTVLVQGFGDTSPVGGGYFALDVTEPDRDDAHSQKPTFRWQLTRDDSGKPLFGTGGTPLITTVFVGSESDGGAREVAVAVLPGGDALPIAGTSQTQASLIMDTDTGQGAFKSTRDGRNYASTDAEPARSLTIVRLDTGEVIRTFRPVKGPFATDVWAETDLDAPITGQPKAFPETTGAVADRIFVGDRDGRLWRVDVSSQDPTKWDMKRMYDAFHDGTSASSQPVILPPVLSVDEVGDVTVAFATGSQDLDSSENRVISLTEKLNDDKEFVAHLNWIHRLQSHDRVTGNMVLFNSGLYYAVSRPPETTGAVCDVGSSKVYGAHYTESLDFEAATKDDRDPDPTTGPGLAPGETALLLKSQSGLVFGVSLEAEPSCASPEDDVTGNDSFGYGSVRMSKHVNPGKYFLSFAASGNDNDSDHLGVLEVRQELTAPRLPVTFQSWAVVYE